jgi:hypothetical protein
LDPFVLLSLLIAATVLIAKSLHSLSHPRKECTRILGLFPRHRAIESEIRSQGDKARSDVVDACRKYKDEDFAEHLRRTPISVLERAKSGARIQALRDAGITNLERIWNWRGEQFRNLPGIGPKSATAIASIVADIVQNIRKEPIKPPSSHFHSEREQALLHSFYRLRWYQTNLESRIRNYSELIESLFAKSSDINKKCGFLRWLVAVFDAQRMNIIRSEIEKVSQIAGGGSEIEKVSEELNAKSIECNRLGMYRIPADVLCEAYAADTAAFDALLEKYFGCKPTTSSSAGSDAFIPPTEPVAMPMRVQTTMAASVPIPPQPADLTNASQVTSPIEAEQERKFWIPPGKSVTFRNWILPGGMVYLGRRLETSYGNEPSLIQINAKVAECGDCHVRQTNYWPNFGEISPEARAAYLHWLSTGRKDPLADIGYVFLFFYGLERRVLRVLLPRLQEQDATVTAELTAIEAEIERLLWIYNGNKSFYSYSSSLLRRIGIERMRGAVPGCFEELELPAARVAPACGAYMKIALGHFAKYKRPLPADWALAWYCSLYASLARKAEEEGVLQHFSETFKSIYEAKKYPGILLAPGSEPLHFSHKCATPGLAGSKRLDDWLPNLRVTNILSSVRTVTPLKEIGAESARLFEPFYQFIDQYPDKRNTPEAEALIPRGSWTSSQHRQLKSIETGWAEQEACRVVPMQDLWLIFADSAPRDFGNRESIQLTRQLAQRGICIDPDPRYGRMPKIGDAVVLYACTDDQGEPKVSRNFKFAESLARLTAMVLTPQGIDAQVSSAVIDSLRSGLDLPERECRRLKARFALYRSDFPTSFALAWLRLGEIKKKEKQVILDSLLKLVSLKGELDPAQVRRLERITNSMELEQNSVYSKLHQIQSGGSTTVIAPRAKDRKAALTEPPTFIDHERIQRLREETDSISKVLAEVFAESDNTGLAEPVAHASQSDPEPAGILASLDPAHSSLLEYLLGKEEWTREEIEVACAERGLMVDGAVERINEAAFEVFEALILEGDDPIEVRQDLVKETVAA